MPLTPAAQLADRILRAARNAQSEEDLKIAVERALEKALTTLGIRCTPEYEKTILSGSADAMYGNVIIEYEKPGKLSKDAGRAETVGQLTRYLRGQTSQHGQNHVEALAKMIGVSIDGRQIIFVRHTFTERGAELLLPGLPAGQLTMFEEKGVRGRFHVLGPYPINEDSVGVFLLYLRSLARKPLTPEALARDFGPSGDVASALVGALHTALKANLDSPRVATFFDEWERLFDIVYGQELGRAEDDARELAKLYGIGGKPELKSLLFTVHTYYALLMKFLAVELISLQGGMLVTSFASDLHALPESELKAKLADLEDGGQFNTLGIVNFLEGDFFRWYLSCWSKDLADVLRKFAQTLVQFEPATSTLQPDSTRDLLKKLYQYLIPQSLRHDLGEYYTPDWLAERLLNQLGYDGDENARLIDPSCGTGTFVVLALRRLRARGTERLLTGKQIAEAALKNVVGFDLNPLAVIAARTNYLLALGDLIRHVRPVEIPIYMCDSLLTPTEAGGQLELFSAGYTIHTTADEFKIPAETVKAREMEKLAALLEEAVSGEYTARDFVARARRELTLSQPATERALKELFETMTALHKRKRDGLWARLIKNAFAPIFVGQFDFVAGNPPWINWESLSQEYREATKQLWIDYGLFSLKGHAARLGGGKKDLAMLFTYAAADRYLKPGGKLGFVITQTVFQTKGAGAGFRRFRMGEGDALGVLAVDNMVDLQPFEGATNRTAVLALQRGRQTKYPVPYTLWKRKPKAVIRLHDTLDEVIKATTRANLLAQPVIVGDPTSPWLTLSKVVGSALRKMIGEAAYDAHSGACTWLNAAFWVSIRERRPDGLIVVSNLNDIGRWDVQPVIEPVEIDLVYPLLRGRDIARWAAEPSSFLILTQDAVKRVGIDEAHMRQNYPKTYAFLKHFETDLRKRSGYKKFFNPKTDPFYTIYNVGPYTLAPHKVGWAREDMRLRASVFGASIVAGEMKPVVPDQTVQFISFENEAEAYFVCGLLNSSPATLVPMAYTTDITTHILAVIAIPTFDPASALHQRLAELSRQAHEMAVALAPHHSPAPRDGGGLAEVEREIDNAATELWGITPAELVQIRRGLEELG